MPTKPMRGIALLGTVALLGACTSDGQPVFIPRDNFGEAFRQTMAAQIIDPDPVYDTAVPESSGDQAAQATARYREGKVKQPERLTTSDISGSSVASGTATQ